MEEEFKIDDEAINTLDSSKIVKKRSDKMKEVQEYKEQKQLEKEQAKEKKELPKEESEEEIINCLKKERVIVRLVPKSGGMVTNKNHVLYGGMAETATRTFVVPMLSSGAYINVLTNNEKKCLERALGLPDNALSIYKKEDNFWDDSNPNGISSVTLRKQDNYLDLSDPADYIRYKILLANKNEICPDMDTLQLSPKATYQFVICYEKDENRVAKDQMTTTMKCYKEFGKIENELDTLATIIETVEGKPIGKNSKVDFLHAKINSIILEKPKAFLTTVLDPLLEYKVLIRKAIQYGVISNRGSFLYLRSDNTPLCEPGEDPTLTSAAKYLSNPRHQDILFAVQAKSE